MTGGVAGTGVLLAFAGPGASASPWLILHKLFFIAWFAVMAVHVTWYAPQLPRLLRPDSPHLERARTALAGAGQRWILLTAALAAGLIIAIATYHLSSAWTGAQKPG
jgi:hypothetical protein